MDPKLKKVLRKRKWIVGSTVLICLMYSLPLLFHLAYCVISEGILYPFFAFIEVILFFTILFLHVFLFSAVSQLKLLFYDLILIMCMVIFFLVIHSLNIPCHDFIQV